MSGDDPHIHVQSNVANDPAAVRTVVAATFGLASDLPSTVTTGCGLQVPYAMTSKDPDQVTCLACREHAHQAHLRFADQVEQLAGTPGMNISTAQASLAAAKYRDLAERFSTPGH